jgi:integrase
VTAWLLALLLLGSRLVLEACSYRRRDQRTRTKAIERANVKLATKKIVPRGDVRPHRLRRTYASLRTAWGDDPVFVSRQIGHEDFRFTLSVYKKAPA